MSATPIYIGGRAPLSLASFTAVVDLTPNDLFGELSLTSDGPQCASCSFVSFLRGVPELERFAGLTGVRDGFDHLPELIGALAANDAVSVQRATAMIGARACYELIAGGPGRLRGIPKIHLIARGADAQRDSIHDWGLASPDGRGTGALLRELRSLHSAGLTRAKIGYCEHAAAVEGWSAFSEQGGVDEWPRVLVEAKRIGFEHLGFAMAYSPCATLQWSANRPLEQMRSKLDVHFRRVDGQSSLMCAENVSGYALFNDTREFISKQVPAPRQLSLRYESLVMEF